MSTVDDFDPGQPPEPDIVRAIGAGLMLLAIALIAVVVLAGQARAMPPEAALPYRSAIIRAAAAQFGSPPPAPALAGQIMQESGFRPDAVSPVGARGIAQFMPATARWAGELAPEFGPPDPIDPRWAIRAAAFYDRWLYDRVQYADECSRWGAALSAYNGGLGWHNRRQARAADPTDFWNSVRLVNPGITAGNQRENERYPARILFEHAPHFAAWGRLVCNAG